MFQKPKPSYARVVGCHFTFDHMDSFLQFMNSWMLVSFGLGFLGMIFLIVVVKTKKENSGRTSIIISVGLVGQCFLTFIIAFTTLSYMKANARQEILTFLKRPNVTVLVDNHSPSDSVAFKLLTDLRNLKNLSAHSSHPTDMFSILLLDKRDTLSLTIGKDSQIKTEFWIFLNKYKTTTSNDIGRFTTNEFK